MNVEFADLSEDARIWIYPSSRKFYQDEISKLRLKVDSFLSSWFANENKVAYSIQYNRFLVFGVESKEPLLTSEIDQLVSFIFELQTTFEIELLDRMNVCFKQGEFVQYKELKDFQKLIKQKAVSKKTIVFDNLIETKADFDEYWEVPITDSWYNRFLK